MLLDVAVEEIGCELLVSVSELVTADEAGTKAAETGGTLSDVGIPSALVVILVGSEFQEFLLRVQKKFRISQKSLKSSGKFFFFRVISEFVAVEGFDVWLAA
jgi:hypothetical protein